MTDFHSAEVTDSSPAPASAPDTSSPGGNPELTNRDLRGYANERRTERREARRLPQEQPVGLDGPTIDPTAPAPPAPERVLPANYPKSWSKDHVDLWNAVPEHVRDHLNRRDNESEAFIRRRQSEADKARFESEQARAEFQQHIEKVAEARKHHINGLFSAYASSFTEVRPEVMDVLNAQINEDHAKLAQLAQTNPELMAEAEATGRKILERKAAIEAQIGHQMQAQQQRQMQMEQYQRQQVATFIKAQDAQFLQNNREFQDPKQASRIREQVLIPYATKVLGFSQQELTAAFASPLARDARAQQALYDAARWHDAKEKARTARPVLRPQPMPPGNNNGTRHGTPDLDRMPMDQYVAYRRKQGGIR